MKSAQEIIDLLGRAKDELDRISNFKLGEPDKALEVRARQLAVEILDKIISDSTHEGKERSTKNNYYFLPK